MKKLLALLIAAPLSACPPCCPPPEPCPPKYQLVDLGLQESDQSEVVAMNDGGVLTGSYIFREKKYFFIWSLKDGTTVMNLPKTAEIVAINNLGQIVGNYNDGGCERGFFWSQTAGFVDLGSLGGKTTHVFAINDRSQVVGESTCDALSLVDNQPVKHAFLWESGKITDLGALAGQMGLHGDHSQAIGINQCGQIIGTANFLIPRKGKMLRSNSHVVIWENNKIRALEPDFKGSTEGHSINDLCLVSYRKSGDQINGFIVKNLSTNTIEYEGEGWEYSRVNNKGHLAISPRSVMRELGKKEIRYLCFKQKKGACSSDYTKEDACSLFNQVAGSEWKKWSFQAFAFNTECWIAGVAENVYGEKHGVVLIPEGQKKSR